MHKVSFFRLRVDSRFLILGLSIQSSAALAAGSSSAKEPIAAVRSYIEAFNRADIEGMAAQFASPGFILDGMAPHVWQGPRAARDWFRDAQAIAQKQNVTEEVITVTGEPLHYDVKGKSAYIVVPVSFSYKVNGKPVRQAGAQFTAALSESNETWRLSSWAWTKGVTEGTPAF